VGFALRAQDGANISGPSHDRMNSRWTAQPLPVASPATQTGRLLKSLGKHSDGRDRREIPKCGEWPRGITRRDSEKCTVTLGHDWCRPL